MIRAALVLCVLLAGCAETVQPAVTSDQVLAVQYKSRTPHGVMTGQEAGIVADAYRKNIATHPAEVPETAGDK